MLMSSLAVSKTVNGVGYVLRWAVTYSTLKATCSPSPCEVNNMMPPNAASWKFARDSPRTTGASGLRTVGGYQDARRTNLMR